MEMPKSPESSIRNMLTEDVFLRMSQTYELPNVVATSLGAATQQAHAIAIVMGLFAGALVSLAQIVNAVPETNITAPISWGAMIVFLYSAIMLSLSGSFLSLVVIKMCSDVPLAAQQKILDEGRPDLITPTENTAAEANINNTPLSPRGGPLSNVVNGEVLTRHILSHNRRLLKYFGMSDQFKVVDRLTGFVLIAASVCTFAALAFWIFLSQSLVTAGLTMVFFGLIAIFVVYVYALAIRKQGWR